MIITNRDEYNKHLTETILAFILPIIVLFVYDVQIRVFKYDSGLLLYLLFCIGEVYLAIIINLEEKKKKRISNVLYSKNGYFYILLFLFSVISLHFFSCVLSGFTPHILKFMSNPSDNPVIKFNVGGSSSSALGQILRVFSLRYGIYPMFLFVFFCDYVKRPRWLKFITVKSVIVSFLIVFAIILAMGEIIFGNDILNHSFCFLGLCYPIYRIFLWFSLFILSFYFLRRKFSVHHALWLSVLILLSCQDVWQYAVYYDCIIKTNMVVTIPFITRYIWWASSSFLLVYYMYEYIHKITFLLSFSFIISLVSSYLFLSNNHFFKTNDYPLRLVWIITYIILAYQLGKKESGKNGGKKL